MDSEQKVINPVEEAESRMQRAIRRLRELTSTAEPSHRAQDVNALFQEELTTGDRMAAWVAKRVGSWPFIIGLSIVLVGWAVLNVVGWFRHWDPYPFVLMNLFLSLQAAYTAPLIMMAQNREAAKDRIVLHEDFETTHRAEEEVRQILNILEQHGELLELLLEKRGRDGAAAGRREYAAGGTDNHVTSGIAGEISSH
jgi:uncharacterized membrane protein